MDYLYCTAAGRMRLRELNEGLLVIGIDADSVPVNGHALISLEAHQS